MGGVFRKEMNEDWLKRQKAESVLQEIFKHEVHDEFYYRSDMARHWSQVHIPIYNYGGWYDIFNQGNIDNFVGLQKTAAAPGAEQRDPVRPAAAADVVDLQVIGRSAARAPLAVVGEQGGPGLGVGRPPPPPAACHDASPPTVPGSTLPAGRSPRFPTGRTACSPA